MALLCLKECKWHDLLKDTKLSFGRCYYEVSVIIFVGCSFPYYWQRAVWNLSSNNRLECFDIIIKSYQDFNSLTFPLLAGTKLNLHGVNYKPLLISINITAVEDTVVRIIQLQIGREPWSSGYGSRLTF